MSNLKNVERVPAFSPSTLSSVHHHMASVGQITNKGTPPFPAGDGGPPILSVDTKSVEQFELGAAQSANALGQIWQQIPQRLHQEILKDGQKVVAQAYGVTHLPDGPELFRGKR